VARTRRAGSTRGHAPGGPQAAHASGAAWVLAQAGGGGVARVLERQRAPIPPSVHIVERIVSCQ